MEGRRRIRKGRDEAEKETCKLALGFSVFLANKQIKKRSREWVRLEKLRTNTSDSGLPGTAFALPAPFPGFEALLPSPWRGRSQYCILRERPG